MPFLKTRINPDNVGVLLELFIWMRWLETYEPSSDADLMARLQFAFEAMPKDLRQTYADQFGQVQGGPDNGPRAMVKYDTAENLRARACNGASAALDSKRTTS